VWNSSIERLNYIIVLLKQNGVIKDYKREKNNLLAKCFCDNSKNEFKPEQLKGGEYKLFCVNTKF